MPNTTSSTQQSPRLVLMTGHAAPICDLAFSPDERTIATAGYDGYVILWDASTGAILAKLTTKVGVNTRLAFSDTAISAISSLDDYWSWDAASGRPLKPVGIPRQWTNGDYEDPDVPRTFVGPCRKIVARCSPFSRSASIADVRSGRTLVELTGYPYSVQQVRFLPGGGLETRYGGGVKIIWSSVGVQALADADEPARVTESPDGSTRAVMHSHGMLVESRNPSGKWTRWLRSCSDVPFAAFSPDGSKLALGVGTYTGTQRVEAGSAGIAIYDVSTQRLLKTLMVALDTRRDLQQLAGAVAAAFSPGGKVLAVGYDGFLCALWDIEACQLLHRLSTHGDFVHSLAFSPDGRTLAVGTTYDEIVQTFSGASGREKRRLESHRGNITSLDFSPSGMLLASGAQDGAVKLWDHRTGRLLATLMPLPSGANVGWIVYTPDGYFDCAPEVESLMRWQVGEGVVPFAEHSAEFRREGLLKGILGRGF